MSVFQPLSAQPLKPALHVATTRWATVAQPVAVRDFQALLPPFMSLLWPSRGLSFLYPRSYCLKRGAWRYIATTPTRRAIQGAQGKTDTDAEEKARFQQEIEGPEPTKPELRPLSRPLGVLERPSTHVKTMKEKMKDMMDTDIIMEQRRHLIKEAGKGYYEDLISTRDYGGKTWIAPNVLIREDKALYLPNIMGKSIDISEVKNTTTMCFGKITILAMLNTRISEIHAKGFTERTHARYKDNPRYQYVQVNLQENILKSWVVNLFVGSMRSTVPKELHPTYLVSSQNVEYIRDPLGMTNSRIGYVYLIDENLKVRWGGCADATADEAKALELCTGVLLKRLEGGKKAKEVEVDAKTQ